MGQKTYGPMGQQTAPRHPALVASTVRGMEIRPSRTAPCHPTPASPCVWCVQVLMWWLVRGLGTFLHIVRIKYVSYQGHKARKNRLSKTGR